MKIVIAILFLYKLTCLSLNPLPDLLHKNHLVVASEDLTLRARIGSGANCYYFDACIRSSNTHVAAKQYNIRDCTTASEKIQRILNAEAGCFANNCSNLISCIATCGVGSSQYLLYRKMDGTLDSRFPEMVPSNLPIEFKLEVVRNIGMDIFKALNHMHSNGWCHNDIHVQNILTYENEIVVSDLDSASVITSEWQKEYDVIATGYVMAQLISGSLSMDDYPRASHYKRELKEILKNETFDVLVYKNLYTKAISICDKEEEKERSMNISPTTSEFLKSLLFHRNLKHLFKTIYDNEEEEETTTPSEFLKSSLLFYRRPHRILKKSIHIETQSNNNNHKNIVQNNGNNNNNLAYIALTLLSNNNSLLLYRYLDKTEKTSDKTINDLIKHKVCSNINNTILTNFQLCRPNQEEICYHYTVKSLNNIYKTSSKIYYSQQSSNFDISRKGNMLNIVDLLVRVEDTPGVFLKGFQIVDNSDDKTIQYKYWSTIIPIDKINLNVNTTIIEYFTDWKDAGPEYNGMIIYLDRHCIDINSINNSGLKGFVLEKQPYISSKGEYKPNRYKIRYKYWVQKFK